MKTNKICVLLLLFLPFWLAAGPLWADWVLVGSGSLNVNSASDAESPKITIYNGAPYVNWSEINGTTSQIYVKYFNGSNWVQLGTGGSLNVNSGQNADYPSIAIYNGTLYVGWQEYSTTYQIYVKYFNGSNWVQPGTGGSLNMSSTDGAWNPSLTIYNGTPYVSWPESIGAIFQIYVKYFNGSNWVQLGTGGSLNMNGAANAANPSIAIYNGTPYVSWFEYNGTATAWQIYVKYFNGSNWVQLGTGGSLNVDSTANAQYPGLTIYNGTPYVCWYENNGTAWQIYVKYFNGSNWVQLGTGGSLNVNSGQNAYYPSIAIYNGTPYVSWQETNGTANQIYVKYFNGSNWMPLGGSLNVNNTNTASYPSLASIMARPM